jgi:hypothetical protein
LKKALFPLTGEFKKYTGAPSRFLRHLGRRLKMEAQRYGKSWQAAKNMRCFFQEHLCNELILNKKFDGFLK